jgi:Zn-dependent membrane protease YugP
MFYGGLGGFNTSYLIILVVTVALGGLTQWYIKRTFSRFSQVRTSSGLTGAQVASRILAHNGIAAAPGAPTNRDSVGIIPTKGSLSDHYDPRKGIVALSETVYGQDSISATAVAAHEVGHAIQTSRRYVWGELRTGLVPVVNFGSSLAPMLIIMGLVMQFTGLFWLGIIFYAGAVLFQVVTLPVELNASPRALAQLRDNNILTSAELPGARKVLTAAAFTYVASALISIMYLLYYLGMGNRR